MELLKILISAKCGYSQTLLVVDKHGVSTKTPKLFDWYKTILKVTNLFPGLLEQTGSANRSTQAGGEKGTIFTERSSLLVNNCKGK